MGPVCVRGGGGWSGGSQFPEGLGDGSDGWRGEWQPLGFQSG